MTYSHNRHTQHPKTTRNNQKLPEEHVSSESVSASASQ